MAWPPTRTQDLDDYALSVLYPTNKKSAIDVVTPDHPLFNMMKKRNGGKMPTEDPGYGPVTEDLMYKTPDRSTKISRSQDLQAITYTPIRAYTQAKYDWIQRIQTLTIGQMEIDNAQGPLAFKNIVAKKKTPLEQEQQNEINRILWEGDTLNQEKVFGIRDFVTITPNSDPSRGSVGGITVAEADASFWKNKSQNFNEAAFAITSGNASSNLVFSLDGSKGMLKMWKDCSNNVGPDGKPDLMPCNFHFYNSLLKLTESRIWVFDKQPRFEIGLSDALYFRSGHIFWDQFVGEDSDALVADTGTLYMLNTSSFAVKFAKGLERKWGSGYRVPGQTGTAWEMSTQYTITINDRRRNGVLYNVLDGTSS